jgi:hypothetical protein
LDLGRGLSALSALEMCAAPLAYGVDERANALAVRGDRVLHVHRGRRKHDADKVYQLIVEFTSHDAGMENSHLPQVGEFGAYLASICDGPLKFRNLDVIRSEQL